MKTIIISLLIAVTLISCEQTNEVPNINVEGYWQVKDKYYVDTATADLYHLMKGENVFYRFSFLKTFDFVDQSALPRKDSLIAYYQVRGEMLMLSNQGPGLTLLSRDETKMMFTQVRVLTRDGLTGEPRQTRTDTLTYLPVTDQTKTAYFDNLLKKWHP